MQIPANAMQSCWHAIGSAVPGTHERGRRKLRCMSTNRVDSTRGFVQEPWRIAVSSSGALCNVAASLSRYDASRESQQTNLTSRPILRWTVSAMYQGWAKDDAEKRHREVYQAIPGYLHCYLLVSAEKARKISFMCRPVFWLRLGAWVRQTACGCEWLKWRVIHVGTASIRRRK